MAGPVVSCDTPGALLKASIRFVPADRFKKVLETMLTGVGVSFMAVAFDTPVTMTLPCSTTLLLSAMPLWVLLSTTACSAIDV